ncbi:hypothetical protein F5888DRAFT_1702094 [Russula emetica]|nr:hypothetical protein F5888DRAFT_1702094 [Russula emetica]
MLSYMSLLVLVLVTSGVSPVRAHNPLKVEGTSHSESSIRPRFKMTPGNLKALAGLGGSLSTNSSPNFHDSTECDSTDQCNAMDFSASTNTNHSAPGIFRARGRHP